MGAGHYVMTSLTDVTVKLHKRCFKDFSEINNNKIFTKHRKDYKEHNIEREEGVDDPNATESCPYSPSKMWSRCAFHTLRRRRCPIVPIVHDLAFISDACPLLAVLLLVTLLNSTCGSTYTDAITYGTSFCTVICQFQRKI